MGVIKSELRVNHIGYDIGPFTPTLLPHLYIAYIVYIERSRSLCRLNIGVFPALGLR